MLDIGGSVRLVLQLAAEVASRNCSYTAAVVSTE